MGKNTKPMLTVLVAGDKLQQFRDYALSKEVSMGWVVNRLLDRVLSGELDVMGDTPSIGVPRDYIENISIGLTRENVESMVKSSIDNQLVDSNRDYIEELIKNYIDSLGISSTGTNHIEGMTRASIEVALEPIKESVSELETYTQSQLASLRDEIKKALSSRAVVPATESIASLQITDSDLISETPSDRVTTADPIANPTTAKPDRDTEKDPNIKPWVEFFKMVGIEAMTATKAQKKENINTRDKQIERGLQAARDLGLGEWIAKPAGRSFVRVDATLPLFQN